MIKYTISSSSIQDLCNGKIVAIWVKRFYETQFCEYATKKIEGSPQITSYPEIAGFYRLGSPYAQAFEDFKNKNIFSTIESYFQNSLEQIEHIRSLFHPYYSPIDKLRLLLDEAWEPGATLKTVNKSKYFAGIVRIMNDSKTALPPHVDRYIPLDSPDIKYKIQLAANIYLNTPKKNGHLKLWQQSISKIDTSQRNKLAVCESQKYLPNPAVSISPECGDLVIFNASLLHAVTGEMEGKRMALGLFIGMRAYNEPLEFWS